MALYALAAVRDLDSRGHEQTYRPVPRRTRLYASPISSLELKLLVEAGRLRLRGDARVTEVFADDRWLVDEPPALSWFSAALDLAWARDPFDRMLVAHAKLRGWKLATADAVLLEHLPASSRIEL